MSPSMASPQVDSKTLGKTFDDHECAVKFFSHPPSERSDLADTAASFESVEGSSDGASGKDSTVGDETCPSCNGNGYHESRFGTFTCQLCKGRGSEPVLDEAVPGQPLSSAVVGVLVVRGPDWQCGDDDGGAGSVGEVVKDIGGGWVQVRWSNGYSDDYRAGFSDFYDLTVHKTVDAFRIEQDDYAAEQESFENWHIQANMPLGATAGLTTAALATAALTASVQNIVTAPNYGNYVADNSHEWGYGYGWAMPTYGAYTAVPMQQTAHGGYTTCLIQQPAQSHQPSTGLKTPLKTPLRSGAPLFVPQFTPEVR